MSNPNKMPYPLQMRAGQPQFINIRPSFVQAWVLALRFGAERSSELQVNRINIGGDEQLRVWPIPVNVFLRARGFLMAIVRAESGITVELESSTDQAVVIEIEFSECKFRA